MSYVYLIFGVSFLVALLWKVKRLGLFNRAPPNDGKCTIIIDQRSKDAYFPTRKTDGSIGYDLKASQYVSIPGGETMLVPTGISLKMPSGYYANIRQKSRHFLKNIHVYPGLIDSDYRGEIYVAIRNLAERGHCMATRRRPGSESVTFSRGDEIAQLEFVKAPDVSIISGKVDPAETVRGDTGFGGQSTNHCYKNGRLISSVLYNYQIK